MLIATRNRTEGKVAATVNQKSEGPSLLHETSLVTIEARNSQELVIALIGPVASGVTTSGEIIRDELASYGYEVTPIIKLSSFIEKSAIRVGVAIPANLSSDKRVDIFQDAGNKLREKFGSDYLAKKAVTEIAATRLKDGFEIAVEGAPQRPRVLRRAHIVDSLKNEAELQLLRKVYGSLLIVVGVFSPDYIRKQRLKARKIPDLVIEKMIDRDQGEGISHGQQARGIFSSSDFFIRNDQSNKESLKRTIKRYVEMVFGVGIHTATAAESAMHEASAAANKSACLSRQVGAAIVDHSGSLIAVGWNDVPKFGGGLYTEDDQNWIEPGAHIASDHDNRCFRWGDAICHNDEEKRSIENKLFNSLRASGVVSESIPDDAIRFAIRGSGIEALLEFSRSIHAEMEAILSIARDARHSLQGATLYTTVYPCHNCARHIVASGIKEVIYIQPYRKSLAITLHHDAISENESQKNCVIFKQFQGVSPRNFELVFKQSAERKKDGRFIEGDRLSAKPLFSQPSDSFTAYELRIAEEVQTIEVEGAA